MAWLKVQAKQNLVQTSLVLIAVCALLVWRSASVIAAPPARDCSGGNAVIVAPPSGATLFGIVQIEGTASLGDEFVYYKIEVAPLGTEAWGTVVADARQQVVNGQLGVWDSASVPDGAYVLRLRVVDPTGNYCEAFATNLNVRNSVSPTPTVFVSPTPEETEAPPIQNAVPTPIPTIASPISEPTPGATATPFRAGPTRTPSPGVGLTDGLGLSSIIEGITDLVTTLVRTFLFGMLTMAAIFFLVGVVFFVRRVL